MIYGRSIITASFSVKSVAAKGVTDNGIVILKLLAWKYPTHCVCDPFSFGFYEYENELWKVAFHTDYLCYTCCLSLKESVLVCSIHAFDKTTGIVARCLYSREKKYPQGIVIYMNCIHSRLNTSSLLMFCSFVYIWPLHINFCTLLMVNIQKHRWLSWR